MKVNNKLLMLLALNSLAVLPGEAAESKTDKMYNNMIKNMETGKSNSNNYKLIENILKQKNKELKDLYKQGDYVVKPEYLEWQIFFSGFYNEKNKGDNTLSSAKYYSDPQKANGDSTLADGQSSLYGDTATDGKFKPYKPKEDSKFVDLGVSLNIKGITKNTLDLAVTPANEVNITPSIISTNIEIPVISETIELQSFSPIGTVTPPDLSKISINWPRATYSSSPVHAVSVTTSVNGTNEVNTGELIYNVNSTSGLMNKTGVELYKGSYTNDGKIEINYDGLGNWGGGVTQVNTFHGVLNENRYFSGPQNANPISFVNNGEFNIFTNIADNGGDVGSVMGIHYYSGSYAENTKIENYGIVRVKQAVWMQFEDTEGTYLSHSSDGRVGNVIVEDRSQGLQLWRCCFVDARDNDTLEYIDPGIIVVRGQSTGINIVESTDSMRSVIMNDNTTNDSAKDSQIIVENGNGLVLQLDLL